MYQILFFTPKDDPYMAKRLNLQTITDNRGSLTVIEKILPFPIKRIFYINNFHGLRGGHRHKLTEMALISINGEIKINVENPYSKNSFILDSPTSLLLLSPEDWHTMEALTLNAILLVLCSHEYDSNDYIIEKYE